MFILFICVTASADYIGGNQKLIIKKYIPIYTEISMIIDLSQEPKKMCKYIYYIPFVYLYMCVSW